MATIGIRASYKAWERNRAIEWAFMVRPRSASPLRGTPGHGSSAGASGSRGANGGGASGSGDHERGLVIHRVTKEISSGGTFPVLTKTNYYDWAALMRVML